MIKRVDTHYISKELEGFMARWYIADNNVKLRRRQESNADD